MPMLPQSSRLVLTNASATPDRARRHATLALVALLLASVLSAGATNHVDAASGSADHVIHGTSLARTSGQLDTAAPGATESVEPLRASGAREGRYAHLRPRPAAGPFAMNLYRRGDFVSQQTQYWCVAASAQTMINIMEPDSADRTRRYQRRLQFQARRLDQDDDGFWRRLMGEDRWRKGHHGLGLQDWAGLLNANGYGPYHVDRAETRKQAIRKAARAIRLTGKPAGLVVWRGAHAWVMSGFEATADPAFTNAYKVTRVYIQDPWYPAVSTIWGASRPPNAAVPVKALARDFLRYDRPLRRHPKRDGRFMLVLPTATDAG